MLGQKAKITQNANGADSNSPMLTSKQAYKICRKFNANFFTKMQEKSAIKMLEPIVELAMNENKGIKCNFSLDEGNLSFIKKNAILKTQLEAFSHAEKDEDFSSVAKKLSDAIRGGIEEAYQSLKRF